MTPGARSWKKWAMVATTLMLATTVALASGVEARSGVDSVRSGGVPPAATDNDGDGWELPDDCNDNDPLINPGATEVCDGVDNNCDDNIDEGVTTTFYFDGDLDGWGGMVTTEACAAPPGFITTPGDCDDTDASINPGATESCDGVDEDCDGTVDNGFDVDGDLYTSCGGDCDDSDGAINPDATEVCGDAIDNDCDGTVDTAPVVGTTVTLDKAGTDAVIGWDDEGIPGPFRVYRGFIKLGDPFVYNHVCMTPALAIDPAVDMLLPLSGTVYYYLVSREGCGGESGLGFDGDGVPRPNAFPCGSGGGDADGDTVGDPIDNCPDAANPGQADADGDTHGDVCDNCPAVPNPAQEDLDGDTLGDACDPDIDGDGEPNGTDNCPTVSNDQTDTDGDGYGNPCDNCPTTPNPGQEDTDVDGIGDICDPDVDDDGVPNLTDNCPSFPNPDQADADGDTLGDACDDCAHDPLNDVDGDGFCGDVDSCPTDPNPFQGDADGDGVGDVCDPCPSNPDLACVACPPGTDPDGDGVCSFVSVLIQEGTSMDYLANTSDPGIEMDWVAFSYPPAGGWPDGVYGVGYESGSGAEDLISTPVAVGSRSVYTRVTGTLADPSVFNRLFVAADYDNGYAVWINGTEVYRSPELPAGPLDWNTPADIPPAHESSNGTDPDYGEPNDVSGVGLGAFMPGTNVVAIGVWNNTGTSSDLVLVPYLSVGSGDNCPDDPNPDQTDGDADGYGDACD